MNPSNVPACPWPWPWSTRSVTCSMTGRARRSLLRHARTADSAYAAAFFTLVEELGIIGSRRSGG